MIACCAKATLALTAEISADLAEIVAEAVVCWIHAHD